MKQTDNLEILEIEEIPDSTEQKAAEKEQKTKKDKAKADKKKDKQLTKERLKNVFKTALILVLIAIIILLLRFKGCNNNTSPNNPVEIENGQYHEQTNTTGVNKENSDIPVMSSVVTISTDKPYVNLYNPESNTKYLKYEIIENDNVVYESKMVQPGYKYSVDLGHMLEVGTHKVNVKITVYDTDGSSMNSTTQSMIINVAE